MKKIKYYLKYSAVFLVFLLATTACEDYLDKAPEADITEKDVFGNFTSFQGFVEIMYNCIMDPDKGGAWNKYLFADETLGPTPYNFDLGNYWGNETYFFGVTPVPQNITTRERRIWEYAWYAIRQANMALEKIDQEGLFEGTDEEKAHIKGQALFFRGWFYFELARFWGGMPYITKVLEPTEEMTTAEFKRLSFQETAKLMAKDFRAAANLLPNHWDQSAPGQKTLGHNRDRINKFHALGYLGKALLFAASPMINEEATGKNEFDPALAKQAAEAFGELLKLADQTGTYKLQAWAAWTDCFFKLSYQRPGGTECIMMPTIYDRTRVRNSTIGATCPSSFGLNSGSSADVITHNYTKYFGMKGGLPIDDPASGYNPADPWVNRDPRFYKTVVVDGDNFSNINTQNKFALLYNGGFHRSGINPATVTGYYSKKFNGMSPTFTVSIAGQLMAYVPYLRLADIYLMYAEAVLFSPGGNPKATASNYTLTAEQAVNVVRARATLPNLDAKFTATNPAFFEELVRERAVELALEGQRFCDLRRWNRNGDPRYLDKTCIDFTRDAKGKPVNLKERVIIRRVAEKKHNWLPIQVKYTVQYEGFPQNPGW